MELRKYQSENWGNNKSVNQMQDQNFIQRKR